MSLPSTQVQQLQTKEFFARYSIENALVILHFHPPFSVAKKQSNLYGKWLISWVSMYGQMKLHVATCTPGNSNAFCKSVCRQCRKKTFWTLLYATMCDWGHLPWHLTIARSEYADTLHLTMLHPIFFYQFMHSWMWFSNNESDRAEKQCGLLAPQISNCYIHVSGNTHICRQPVRLKCPQISTIPHSTSSKTLPITLGYVWLR
jgi:hypothetical protein